MTLKKASLNRREFVKASALFASAPLILSANAWGANDRITLGCIGVGGRGTGVMTAFMRESAARVIAVCDVKRKTRNAAKKLVEERYGEELAKGAYKGCTAYKDFEELLAREDLDAVSIATPDHWHVPIGIAAAKAGKDMFIEKPLSYTLAEGRYLSNACKKYKRIFQHGTQQRTDNKFRFICELVRNQYIGELKTMEVGSPASGVLGDQSPAPVPDGIDYSKWLGAAQKKPYTENRTTTPTWYFISDYTIGFVSGWGVHHLDIAQWGNDTDHTGPLSIEGTGVFPKAGIADTATAWDIEMKYANGVTMRYTDNLKCKQGVKFIGTKGWVHVNRSGVDADPKTLLDIKIAKNDVHLYKAPNLQQNLLECIRSRKETICPIETAHRTVSLCHLSQITMLLGRKMIWNPNQEQFLNDEEADAMLKVRDTVKSAYPYEYFDF